MVSEGQKLLILDMSMPRNADPSLGKLEGVTLLDVDEISQYALSQLQERFVHMPKAEQIVNEELVEFEEWLESLKVAPLLGSVKQGLQEFRDVELDKLKSESLRDEDQMKRLSDRLIQKVTTQVATYLKTKSDCIEDDLHLFQQVFNVKDS
jgi:glutamyl-tRNA reductase